VKLDLYSKMLCIAFGEDASDVVGEVTNLMLDLLPSIVPLPLPFPNNTSHYRVPDNINMADLGQAVVSLVLEKRDTLLVELASLKDENSYTY
jgi:hypothetical protein